MARSKNLWPAIVAAVGLTAAGSGAFAQQGFTFPQGKTQAERAEAMKRLPNWTGLWNPIGGLVFDLATAEPPEATAQVPGDRIRPPYNPEWSAKYEAILARTKAGFYGDPITHCSPHGMPRLMGGIPGPLEFVVTPEQVWIQWEWGMQVRRIFTDGRDHPPAEDRWPTWTGHSIGHWEGDTLVVDTVSMKGGDDSPYDRTGAPHSDEVHLVERMRMIDPNTLENRMTITDPVAFTRPWEVVRRYRRAPADSYIGDLICSDSQRNPIVGGQTQVLLPNDDPNYVLGAAPDDGPTARAPTAVDVPHRTVTPTR